MLSIGDLIVLVHACIMLLLAYVIRASVGDLARSIADLHEVMARMKGNSHPHEPATGSRERVPGKPDKAPKEDRRDLQPAARGTATEQKQFSAMRRFKSCPLEAAEGDAASTAKSTSTRAPLKDRKAHSMHSGPAELVERRRHYGRHASSAVTPTQRSTA